MDGEGIDITADDDDGGAAEIDAEAEAAGGTGAETGGRGGVG